MISDNVIKLRAPEPTDVDTMYMIENDPSLWSDGVTFAPVSRKQLWDYVDSYDGNIYAAGQLRLIVETVGDSSVAGVVDLYDYDRVNRRAYVGITISPAWRGKGIGRRTLRLLCRYCCEQLDLKQLAAVVRADNEASRALFEHCGFILTGQFPGWIRRGDRWVDAVHYQRIFEPALG